MNVRPVPLTLVFVLLSTIVAPVDCISCKRSCSVVRADCPVWSRTWCKSTAAPVTTAVAIEVPPKVVSLPFMPRVVIQAPGARMLRAPSRCVKPAS